MSLFAHIIDGIVINVIVAEQEFVDVQDDLFIKYEDDGILIKNIPAQAGDTYDDINDVFIRQQPYPSWSLNDNYEWMPPIPYPDEDIRYEWNEVNQSWDEII